MTGPTRKRHNYRARAEIAAYEAAAKLRDAPASAGDPRLERPPSPAPCDRCGVVHPSYLECPTGTVDRPARELAHAADPETSHEAAGGNADGKATNRRRCLEAHDNRAPALGLTDDEVSELTGLELHEARRRCADLRRLGLLEWRLDAGTGEAVTRPSSGGKRSTVAVLTPAGREELS